MPLIAKAHSAWDSAPWRRGPAVHSEIGGLSVLYAGLRDGLRYTLEFTEQRRQRTSDEKAVRRSFTIAPRSAQKLALTTGADIIIVGTNRRRARRLPVGSSLVIPLRVHFVVDCEVDADRALSRISKGVRRDVRQQSRKHDWHFSVEHDTAIFDYFYDRMYVPTMEARYGSMARTEGKASAYECLYRSGVLFILSDAGEPVAGHLCHWDPKHRVLTSRLLGVLDGSEGQYAAGVVKVMYCLMIEWATKNQVRQLDLQGTEPFLSKGTYQMKRRFGSRVVYPPNHFGDKRLWLQVLRDTEAVRDFLTANPVVVENHHGSLDIIYFFDRQRPPRLDLQSESPGIERVRRVDLDDFLSGTATPPHRQRLTRLSQRNRRRRSG
ncbi:GNAT family N-acetyltransferase [Actinoallomurus rhizosphaericola]|uniref:GNAT family N-acetyltransferase n=1 Tax=Actinoallomurus rhizosphaericola TaxID=2952536 RepID=UPI0020923D76|nr:GNAT family N-acetyltransferase [Actinoallomurus rhizosphaericola]MCO5997989.1 GNAT family N-acetyltransferase [Actinoallomurus rhizosphaericola]